MSGRPAVRIATLQYDGMRPSVTWYLLTTREVAEEWVPHVTCDRVEWTRPGWYSVSVEDAWGGSVRVLRHAHEVIARLSSQLEWLRTRLGREAGSFLLDVPGVEP